MMTNKKKEERKKNVRKNEAKVTNEVQRPVIKREVQLCDKIAPKPLNFDKIHLLKTLKLIK